MATTEEVKQL